MIEGIDWDCFPLCDAAAAVILASGRKEEDVVYDILCTDAYEKYCSGKKEYHYLLPISDSDFLKILSEEMNVEGAVIREVNFRIGALFFLAREYQLAKGISGRETAEIFRETNAFMDIKSGWRFYLHDHIYEFIDSVDYYRVHGPYDMSDMLRFIPPHCNRWRMNDWNVVHSDD